MLAQELDLSQATQPAGYFLTLVQVLPGNLSIIQSAKLWRYEKTGVNPSDCRQLSLFCEMERSGLDLGLLGRGFSLNVNRLFDLHPFFHAHLAAQEGAFFC